MLQLLAVLLCCTSRFMQDAVMGQDAVTGGVGTPGSTASRDAPAGADVLK